MTKSKPGKLILSLIVPLLFGGLGALFTTPNLFWYNTIIRPSFTPPDYVFAPVWTILYFLMGLAWYLVWQHQPHFWQFAKKVLYRDAIGVFFAQLVLGVLWSLSFFALHMPGVAFTVILFLWFMVLVNGVLFFRLYKPAGLILIPYFLWVTFALVLNFAIFSLN